MEHFNRGLESRTVQSIITGIVGEKKHCKYTDVYFEFLLMLVVAIVCQNEFKGR